MPYEPAKVVRPASFFPSGFNKFCFNRLSGFVGVPRTFFLALYPFSRRLAVKGRFFENASGRGYCPALFQMIVYQDMFSGL